VTKTYYSQKTQAQGFWFMPTTINPFSFPHEAEHLYYMGDPKLVGQGPNLLVISQPYCRRSSNL